MKNKIHIDKAPSWVYNCRDDVYWIIKTNNKNEETAIAMFYSKKEAVKYVQTIFNLDDVKIVENKD